jgi:xeroderma pigmentosum group C-complementing protein
VQGLRIRQRMREQYGGGADGGRTSGLGDVGSSPAVASGGNDGDHDHDGHGDEGGVQPATAGGFLTGVEHVVQPYSLPRPVHVVFSSPPRSPNTASPSPAPLTASPVLAGPGAAVHGTLASSSSFPASANDDTGDERAQAPPPFPVEIVEDSEPDDMSMTGLEGAQSQIRRIPKSMAALAAEAAEAQARAIVVDGDVAEAPQMSEEAARISRTATHVAPRTRTITRTKTETKTRSRTETETESKTETKSRTRAKTGTPGRKRARTQDDDDGDGDDGSASVRFGEDGGEHVGSRSGSRVAKRARKNRHVDVDGEDLVPVPASDRVLRTRKGKSPAQLAQERDQELAVQRAVAE